MYSNLLVGTDGSETATRAVREAAELAAKLGAKLSILSAYSPVPEAKLKAEAKDVPEQYRWMINPREEVDKTLEAAAASIEDIGIEVMTAAREGSAADVIIDYAEESSVDLIVMGNKGMTGAKRFLLGSVPNSVTHQSPCDVLIVHTT